MVQSYVFACVRQADYNKKIALYKASLTDEQKNLILQQKEEKKIVTEKRQLKKKTRELEKPKRPTNAFAHFVTDEMKKIPNSKLGEMTSLLKGRWTTMADKEKNQYIKAYNTAFEKYS